MNLLLRTAEAPPTRRRAGKLAPLVLLGACAAFAGCTQTHDMRLYKTDDPIPTKGGVAEGGGQDDKDQKAKKDVKDKDKDQGVVAAFFGGLFGDASDSSADSDADASSSGSWFDFSRLDPSTAFGLYPVPKPPPPPVDSFVVRPDGLAPEKTPATGGAEARLAGARDLFRRGEYAKAEVLFHAVAQDSKASSPSAQEGLFFEAECLRLQGYYPRAADTYNDLLNKYSTTPYRDQAVQHMFDIANYWLDDTRKEMQEWQEYKEQKRWFFWPTFAAWDKYKPVFDEQGRAVEKLEQVRFNDINGPLADQALFFAGSVKMYNGDWKDADEYFTQIYEHHPNSPLAPKAIEFAIMAKNLSTGGSMYDGRKAAEARKLVDAALRNYPELANDETKRVYLMKQLAGITLQQADKDFQMAQFWKRTGHPGAAYFQFGVVKQRYPNTDYAAKADKEMQELGGKLEKTGGEEPPRKPTADWRPAQQVIPASLPSGMKP